MATVISHAVSALGIGALFSPSAVSRRWWALGAVYAGLPDLDYLGFRYGIPYEHLLGHRGITHSVAFAVVLGLLTAAAIPERWLEDTSRRVLAFYLVICIASHGVLDALTDGGMGVAFFAPFSEARHFLPWGPISVAPLSVSGFFSPWGMRALASELLWIWLPSLVLLAIASARRRSRATGL